MTLPPLLIEISAQYQREKFMREAENERAARLLRTNAPKPSQRPRRTGLLAAFLPRLATQAS